MKIYGKITRRSVPVKESTKEIYYIILEKVPKNKKHIKRQNRITSKAIIFVGLTIAYEIWAFRNQLKKEKGDTDDKRVHDKRE